MADDSSNVDHVEVFVGIDDQYYWRAKARNGEIVAVSEAHTREEDAARAADGVFPNVTIIREA
jgi:uncharacterized protein YegP (UPF0339 family)